MSLAHEAWVVDTTDQDALLKLASEKQIDAICTAGTDAAVPALGYICERLGLAGIDYETALDCSNKIRMQERFAAAGVPAAAYRLAGSPEDAFQGARQIGYPVIVKAPNSSGSRGIAIADGQNRIGEAFAVASGIAQDGQVLIEEMLEGEEFGAQVIVIDGRVAKCLCHNDTVTPRPIRVPIGHSCPSRLSEDLRRETSTVCQSAVDALGIRTAVCNADLIATKDGVRLLEIGARIGATGIPEVIRLCHGVDLYDVALRMAMGETPETSVGEGSASAVLIIRAPDDGKLARCRVPADFDESAPRAPEAPANERVVDIHFDYSEGEQVRKFRTGPDRIGHVVVTATSASDAERFAERVVGSLEIRVEPESADFGAAQTARPVDSNGVEGGDGV